jgi:hypothetical protein
MNSIYCFVKVAACAALCLIGTDCMAVTYNFAGDFQTVNNPNGPWSYRSALVGALPSTSTLMVFPDVTGGNWTTTYPNDSFDTIGPNGHMHPGNTSDAIVAFTNKTGGPATFSFVLNSFDEDNNNSSDGKSLTMWLGDSLLNTQSLAGNYAGSVPWSSQLTMAANQTFYLRLNSKTQNFGDSQIEQLTVTQVPEPSTLALAALGGLGMLIVTQRRR